MSSRARRGRSPRANLSLNMFAHSSESSYVPRQQSERDRKEVFLIRCRRVGIHAGDRRWRRIVLRGRGDGGNVDLKPNVPLEHRRTGAASFVLDTERHRAGNGVAELGDLATKNIGKS